MRDGWMVYNKNDVFIGKSIKEYGEWAQGEIDICRKILTPTDFLIEVGSNIGTHTLALSKIVNKGRVFAFEPQNVIFQNLCANISLNSISNCFCSPIALSDKKDEELYFPDFDFTKVNNYGAMSFLKTSKTDSTIQANVDTLDDRFLDLNQLKILKIDAEGMELNIIKGGINLIKRTKPFLYVENHIFFIEKSQELIELLWSLDYKLFWHITSYYNKDNFFENPNNIFKNYYHCNMLGVQNQMKISTDLPEVKDSSFHPFRKK